MSNPRYTKGVQRFERCHTLSHLSGLPDSSCVPAQCHAGNCSCAGKILIMWHLSGSWDPSLGQQAAPWDSSAAPRRPVRACGSGPRDTGLVALHCQTHQVLLRAVLLTERILLKQSYLHTIFRKCTTSSPRTALTLR